MDTFFQIDFSTINIYYRAQSSENYLKYAYILEKYVIKREIWSVPK